MYMPEYYEEVDREKEIEDLLWAVFCHGEASGERFAGGGKPHTGTELVENTVKKILDICRKT